MSEEDVKKFVDNYMPAYAAYRTTPRLLRRRCQRQQQGIIILICRACPGHQRSPQ